jgi:hypothetical protein
MLLKRSLKTTRKEGLYKREGKSRRGAMKEEANEEILKA